MCLTKKKKTCWSVTYILAKKKERKKKDSKRKQACICKNKSKIEAEALKEVERSKIERKTIVLRREEEEGKEL